MLIKADGTCVLPANCIGQCYVTIINCASLETRSWVMVCALHLLYSHALLLTPDCPAGQTASPSKALAPTCTNRNPPEDQPEMLRCSCPAGMLIKGDTCVLPDDCGSASGHGSGDPHYRTYDGRFYDLFDHCSHIFTQDCADDTFTVISITSDRCSRGGAPTCIERAVVQVPELKAEIVLTGRPLQFSFVGDAPPAADLSVVTTNVITVSIFKLGVVVNFGLYYLSVTVPGSYFGKMCGLLGNFDGNPANDFQLPNGTVVNGPTLEFEMAYRADYPNDGCDAMVPQVPEPCVGEALARAEDFCFPLLGADFTACHASISPNQSFADCMLDHCYCATTECGCSVILNYAERCLALGITVGPLPDPCGMLPNNCV